jgi:hypothetical protein
MKRFAAAACIFLYLLLSGCAHDTPRVHADPAAMLRDIQASYALALEWFLNAFLENGRFTYIYDPFQDRSIEGRDTVRQLMASRLLADLAAQNPAYKARHQRNLDFIFSQWYRETEDGRGLIQAYGRSELGANAMFLRTLVYSPLYSKYEAQARRTAEGIVSLIQEDGSFQPYLEYPEGEVDKKGALIYYSGEAILSLAEYAAKTGDTRFRDAAVRAQDHYLVEYVDRIKKNYSPAYVPWHTMSMRALYKATGDPRYVEAVFVLNDRLLKLQDTEEAIGRFFQPKYARHGGPHAARDGISTESLAHAYEMALDAGDGVRADRYLEAVRLSLKNLESLQFQREFETHLPGRGNIRGAFRSSAADWSIRVDNVQHTMDAYRKLMEVLSRRR